MQSKISDCSPLLIVRARLVIHFASQRSSDQQQPLNIVACYLQRGIGGSVAAQALEPLQEYCGKDQGAWARSAVFEYPLNVGRRL